MPIRPELRKFYGRVWRTVTRPRILKRAGDKCEQCGVPNHTEVKRVGGCWLEVTVCWKLGATQVWMTCTRAALESKPEGRIRKVRIVLTVAHLNHVSGDDRDENLKALCQWCHLNYDLLHHKETRTNRKDAGRPLLLEATV